MKTFTLSEAIQFINESGYYSNRLTAIQRKGKDNAFEFLATFESGFILYVNMDEGTHHEAGF